MAVLIACVCVLLQNIRQMKMITTPNRHRHSERHIVFCCQCMWRAETSTHRFKSAITCALRTKKHRILCFVFFAPNFESIIQELPQDTFGTKILVELMPNAVLVYAMQRILPPSTTNYTFQHASNFVLNRIQTEFD